MRFDTSLVRGKLIRRYMRFLADVELDDGRVIKAHCPNPGSMMGLKDPGLTVWLEPNDDPKKKLDWGWRLAEMPTGAMVGIDTGAANKVVGEALRAGLIPDLSGEIRAEVKYGANSRVDFVVDGAQPTYVEVKSVTLMREPGLAEFPDSVTTRGAKHLRELAQLAQSGTRAVLLYLVQRDDCDRVSVARDLDPGYAQALSDARAAGVEVRAHRARLNVHEITLGEALPVFA